MPTDRHVPGGTQRDRERQLAAIRGLPDPEAVADGQEVEGAEGHVFVPSFYEYDMDHLQYYDAHPEQFAGEGRPEGRLNQAYLEQFAKVYKSDVS